MENIIKDNNLKHIDDPLSYVLHIEIWVEEILTYKNWITQLQTNIDKIS